MAADAFSVWLDVDGGDGEPKRLSFTFPADGSKVVKIGRCNKSDIPLTLGGISWNHAELRLQRHSDASGEPRLVIKDLSVNGTGVETPAGAPPQRLQKQVDTIVIDGSRIVFPMKVQKVGPRGEQRRQGILVHFGRLPEADDATSPPSSPVGSEAERVRQRQQQQRQPLPQQPQPQQPQQQQFQLQQQWGQRQPQQQPQLQHPQGNSAAGGGVSSDRYPAQSPMGNFAAALSQVAQTAAAPKPPVDEDESRSPDSSDSASPPRAAAAPPASAPTTAEFAAASTSVPAPAASFPAPAAPERMPVFGGGIWGNSSNHRGAKRARSSSSSSSRHRTRRSRDKAPRRTLPGPVGRTSGYGYGSGWPSGTEQARAGVERGEAMMRDGRLLEDRGRSVEAFETYKRGLWCLLKVLPCLAAETQQGAVLRDNVESYLERAAKLKERRNHLIRA